MLLIDDYTRMTWVSFLKNKFKEFDNYEAFQALVENETYLKIKCLILDNGGEFKQDEFVEFYEERGIKRHFLAARDP